MRTVNNLIKPHFIIQYDIPYLVHLSYSTGRRRRILLRWHFLYNVIIYGNYNTISATVWVCTMICTQSYIHFVQYIILLYNTSSDSKNTYFKRYFPWNILHISQLTLTFQPWIATIKWASEDLDELKKSTERAHEILQKYK